MSDQLEKLIILCKHKYVDMQRREQISSFVTNIDQDASSGLHKLLYVDFLEVFKVHCELSL